MSDGLCLPWISGDLNSKLLQKTPVTKNASESNDCIGGICANETGSDDDFYWGIGGEFRGEHLRLRGEIQADTDFPDVLGYTIGLGYAF